jgi:N6-adenosine-specific RNA methylase IME4
VVADPPWQYNSTGNHLRSTFDHRPKSFDSEANTASSNERYGSMSIRELKELNVGLVSDTNAHLYLWTTNSFMVEAHDLARAWGFEPKTILTWGKVKQDGTPSARMGYYFRGATEHVVFAVRGKQPLLVDRAVPNLLLLPRILQHSVKPEAFFDLVEEVSPGPYLEMFARRDRPGWSHWGNELETDVVIKKKKKLVK